MSPIPVQDADASTALAQGFGLRGKVSLSMDEVIVPVALVRDFTEILDRSPTVIHLATDATFGANTSIDGITYTVPLGRRAIIDYMQCCITLDDQVGLSGRMDLHTAFTPAGLLAIFSTFTTFGPGYGFGVYPFLKVASGPMNPGDRWKVGTVSAVPPTPPGRLTSTLHGIEYDETP